MLTTYASILLSCHFPLIFLSISLCAVIKPVGTTMAAFPFHLMVHDVLQKQQINVISFLLDEAHWVCLQNVLGWLCYLTHLYNQKNPIKGGLETMYQIFAAYRLPICGMGLLVLPFTTLGKENAKSFNIKFNRSKKKIFENILGEMVLCFRQFDGKIHQQRFPNNTWIVTSYINLPHYLLNNAIIWNSMRVKYSACYPHYPNCNP